MIKLNERSLFSLFLFLFAMVMFISAMNMRNDVILIPRIFAIIMVILSGIQLIIDLIPGIKARRLFQKETSKVEKAEQKESTNKEIKSDYLFIGWMTLFVILIFLTNMIIASIIACFIYLKWISKESWKFTILYSVIFGLSIYLVFVIGMDVYYFI